MGRQDRDDAFLLRRSSTFLRTRRPSRMMPPPAVSSCARPNRSPAASDLVSAASSDLGGWIGCPPLTATLAGIDELLTDHVEAGRLS